MNQVGLNYITTLQHNKFSLFQAAFMASGKNLSRNIVVVLTNLFKQYSGKNMNSSVKKAANSCLQAREVWIFNMGIFGKTFRTFTVHRSWWMVRRPHGSSLMANPAKNHFEIAACSKSHEFEGLNQQQTQKSLTKTSSISGSCRVFSVVYGRTIGINPIQIRGNSSTNPNVTFGSSKDCKTWYWGDPWISQNVDNSLGNISVTKHAVTNVQSPCLLIHRP